MKGVVVPYSDAEEFRKNLLGKGVLLSDFKPVKKENHIVFPVLEGGEEGFAFEKYAEKETFKQKVKEILTEAEEAEAIYSYDVIGDIAIIQVPEVLVEKEQRIGEALLSVKPNIRSVRKRGEDHQGKFRTQNTVYVAGEDKTETIHMEHGTRICVDVDDVYFSPRLSTERGRVSGLVGTGETVLVLFDGCGPFSLVLAKNNECSVLGVEWNERGVGLAKKSAEMNNVRDRVNTVNGDVREVVPSLSGFDRVLMPAPHNANEYVDTLHKGLFEDSGWLHLYLFVEEERIDTVGEEIKRTLNGTFETVTSENKTLCGQKSPGVYRVCYDFAIRT